MLRTNIPNKHNLAPSFRRRPEAMGWNTMDSGLRRNDEKVIPDVGRSRRTKSFAQRGFTLVEMVMVTLVIGMLVITLGMMLNSGVRAFDEGRNTIDTLSSLRLATERVARELRTVRRNPTTPTDFDFIYKTANSVQFRRLENDGTTVTTVTISASAPNLTLAYSTPAGSYVLTDQLGSLALRYLMANGTTTTASNTDVAFVEIDLVLVDGNDNSYPQYTRVALRNRQ